MKAVSFRLAFGSTESMGGFQTLLLPVAVTAFLRLSLCHYLTLHHRCISPLSLLDPSGSISISVSLSDRLSLPSYAAPLSHTQATSFLRVCYAQPQESSGTQAPKASQGPSPGPPTVWFFSSSHSLPHYPPPVLPAGLSIPCCLPEDHPTLLFPGLGSLFHPFFLALLPVAMSGPSFPLVSASSLPHSPQHQSSPQKCPIHRVQNSSSLG
jgi:hypothetical protein